MALRLAPYNNAMRLGQGFNSYTQQICVDDAVVIDPDRTENVVTNDGVTMRIMAQTTAQPSAWTRQREIVLDDRAGAILTKKVAAAAENGASRGSADAKAELDEKMDHSAEDTPKGLSQGPTSTGNETEKSDSDSIEKVEHHETKENEETKSAESDETALLMGKMAAVLRQKPGEKPGATPSRVYPVAKELPVSQAQKGAEAQTWKRPKGVLASSKAKDAERQREIEDAERVAREKEERERIAEQAAYRKEVEKEARDEERARRAEDRKEQQKIREEKRNYEAQRREENRKAIANAADVKSLTLQDLDKIKAQNQFADRFVGMTENQEDIAFDPTAPRGPSQTVVYTSKFVDRLSDVTDDMSVSGSLSIKAAKVGGSGRGSFVDSDKFKESDLNFYISVKVINQTLNFKDALIFNPLRSVGKDKFPQVYGDSFISGFLEGGEFNALVSMKILNKAKLTDIKAEAKVAFTAGPIDVTAEANVGIARSNIETNTETTIQVSWCGGGHIKPMEQQWDIKSLMAAASRFADLVAECPQRTYAILTKYESLRSFVARESAEFTPLQYENAQIYTNALLDSFMSYKSLYKRIGEQIFNVQGKTLEIISWEKKDTPVSAVDGAPSVGDKASKVSTSHQAGANKDPDSGIYPYNEDLNRFEASLKGLSDARKAIRRQMMRIVNEVDLIENSPKIATDEDHEEPFQSPVTFETRLPDVVVPEARKPKNNPLTGSRIMAKPQSEDELKEQLRLDEEAAKAPDLYVVEDDLTLDERSAFDKLKTDRPGIGQHLRVSSAVGSPSKGVPFNNLEFLQEDWGVDSIRVEIAYGAVACVEITYDNGLLLRKGKRGGGQVKELDSFQPGERVAYGSIEHGVPLGSKDGPCVLAVRLYTNHGRRLLGQATTNDLSVPGRIKKDGEDYGEVTSVYVDSPLSKGTFKGFFGRSSELASLSGGIMRLGLIWGDFPKDSSDTNSSASGVTSQAYDYAAQTDGPKTKVTPKRTVTCAQAGLVEPSTWSQSTPNFSNVVTRNFQPQYGEVPRMLSGLAKVDQEKGPAAIRLGMNHQNVTPAGFESFSRTYGGARSYAPKMSWLTLPENDVHFETGVFDSDSVARSADMQSIKARVPFANKFPGTPKVVTWLYELNFGPGWHSMATNASNITQDSFDIDIATWAGRNFDRVRLGWLAFNDTGSVGHAKAGRIRVKREERFKSGETVKFEGEEFSKTPAVFFALAQLDAGDDRNLRLTAEVLSTTQTGFTYNCGTWADADDHNMDHSDWVWIAIE